MAAEDTGAPQKDSGDTALPGSAGSKASGDEISADTFRQMLTILKDMRSHTHEYFDDYSTACECQCQCSRGTI